jgi:Zn-dependent peptidase ImmA (M78 family)
MPLALAAKRIGVSEAKLIAVEAGESRLTFGQLKEAASAYRRPLALFFLAQPPPPEPTVRDFRMHPDAAGSALSSEVHVALRRARQRRDEAIELAASTATEVPRFGLTADPLADVENIAATLRAAMPGALGRVQAGSYDAAFKARKDAAENLGVLVFETSRIPTEAMRGASLWFEQLPVVVLNGGDSFTGRSFTLLHELTHLLLRTAGVCDLEPNRRQTSEARTERLCDSVAAAALMPEDEVRAVLGDAKRRDWSMEELSDLSHIFRVSREAMLLRLVTLRAATTDHYLRMRPEFRAEYLAYKASQKKKDEPGGPSPAVMAVRNLGRPFVRLVLNAYDGDVIDLATVSDYLGVKLRHIERVRELALGAAG